VHEPDAAEFTRISSFLKAQYDIVSRQLKQNARSRAFIDYTAAAGSDISSSDDAVKLQLTLECISFSAAEVCDGRWL